MERNGKGRDWGGEGSGVAFTTLQAAALRGGTEA